MLSLEDEKKLQQAGLKRKAVSQETDGLKKLQFSIQNDIAAAVLKSADEFAENAEKLHVIMFIAMSNSLRRTAKDKEVELKSVTDQLEAFRVQLQDLTCMTVYIVMWTTTLVTG